MAIQSRRSGSWSTPTAGSIRVKSGGAWRTAVSVKVKQSGAWVDSGYVAYPNPATSFTGSGGNGDNRQVTFTWTAPTSGATVSGYRLYVYNSSNVQIATVDTGNVTSYTYTFGAASTTYYVRLKTLGVAGESTTFATNPAAGTRLQVVTGSVSSTYPIYGWSGTVSFTPGYWTQSTWPGEPYGDYTYHGSKAFDNDFGTYWTGQSWAWPGGSEWIGFVIGAVYTPIKIVNLINWPGGNACGTLTLDQWDGANFNYTGKSWTGATVYGGQIIDCNIEIPQGYTYYYRIWYTNLGYNPTAYGTYRVLTNEISGGYQYITQTGTGTNPAGSNTVSNA